MPRGGRRPGAGAPRGNINAVKNGPASATYQRAVLILAVAPEVRSLFRALQHADGDAQKHHFENVLDLALKAIARDPALA